MRIVAIDPGSEESAVLTFSMTEQRPAMSETGILPNNSVLDALRDYRYGGGPRLAIEMVGSYGMPVGRTTMDTLVWIGRFVETWGGRYELVPRRQQWGGAASGVYGKEGKHEGVCMALCGTTRAKDSNIRQALIDRFGPGKERAIGTKKSPGPLFGIKTHLWAALAVAVTVADAMEKHNA